MPLSRRCCPWISELLSTFFWAVSSDDLCSHWWEVTEVVLPWSESSSSSAVDWTGGSIAVVVVVVDVNSTTTAVDITTFFVWFGASLQGQPPRIHILTQFAEFGDHVIVAYGHGHIVVVKSTLKVKALRFIGHLQKYLGSNRLVLFVAATTWRRFALGFGGRLLVAVVRDDCRHNCRSSSPVALISGVNYAEFFRMSFNIVLRCYFWLKLVVVYGAPYIYWPYRHLTWCRFADCLSQYDLPQM